MYAAGAILELISGGCRLVCGMEDDATREMNVFGSFAFGSDVDWLCADVARFLCGMGGMDSGVNGN